MAKTFVLLKPDAMERGLAGEIVKRFEQKNLKVIEARILEIKPELARRHYFEHTEKDFYPELEAFIGRSPCLALVLEGPEDIVEVVRKMMGATNPNDADPGTIRGDYGIQVTENLVHGSDSRESADREIQLFFGA